MFQNVVVKNFRCFTGLVLRPLGRINLIAGKNNTGKTALLEAIHLHNNPADWQLPLRINRYRGIDPEKAALELTRWLFWNQEGENGLEISSQDEQGISRTLILNLVDAQTALERYPEAEKQLRNSMAPGLGDPWSSRLVLRYQQPGEPERVSIGVQTGHGPNYRGITYITSRIPWNIHSVFLASGVADQAQDVQFFGELELAKRQEEILPALQIVEPRLQRLSLVPLASEPVIHGDIGLARLVPVPLMGEGLRRILSIVLGIANAPGGVVLIDEIENGLHYSVQKQVWQAIAKAARAVDAQVFATTHSWECLRWAHEAFEEDGTYDLRLHRLDRNEQEISVVSYNRDMIETALYSGLEMR